MRTSLPESVGLVIIGRNEGGRLVRALERVKSGRSVVYVDSASSDGSAEAARSRGFTVIELDPQQLLSAARARNAGLSHLITVQPDLRFIQMLDGDCLLSPAWIASGSQYLNDHNRVDVVFGVCKESNPGASVYNALCNLEWRNDPGEVASSGGNAMFRVAALRSVGGFDEELIAGEEPDLCHRLQQRGSKVVALAQPMVEHDAAIFHFAQWWKRTMRGGFAYAQLVQTHGTHARREWRNGVRSLIIWGLAFPAAFLGSTVAWILTRHIGAAVVISVTTTVYLVQVMRIALRETTKGTRPLLALQSAGFTVLGKIPQMLGWLKFKAGTDEKIRQSQFEYKQT